MCLSMTRNNRAFSTVCTSEWTAGLSLSFSRVRLSDPFPKQNILSVPIRSRHLRKIVHRRYSESVVKPQNKLQLSYICRLPAPRATRKIARTTNILNQLPVGLFRKSDFSINMTGSAYTICQHATNTQLHLTIHTTYSKRKSSFVAKPFTRISTVLFNVYTS